MREDFAVFILTHGRAKNQLTLKSLQRQGYSGRWYLIIDNEDDQQAEYISRYGADHVIVFDKVEEIARTDTMDNFAEHRAADKARNTCYRIAKDMGIKYFLMCDDDFTGINYRYIEKDKLASKKPENGMLDAIFQAMIDFIRDTGTSMAAFAQGGDLIGGVNSNRFHKRFLRKAINSMFCKTENPIEFKGTMDEDFTAYTTLGSRGVLFFTYVPIVVNQMPPQSMAGGMTEAYNESGKYLQAFYPVMSMPSCMKICFVPKSVDKIKPKVSWEMCIPKIIDEKWRKQA